MSFDVTLTAVAVMLLYAIPGYIMIRVKSIQPSAIPAFAKLLMYVCQPCLTIYAFSKVTFSMKLFVEMIWFFVITLVLQVFMLGLFHILLKSKRNKIKYRVCNVGICFGNVAFMGIPLVEALLPEYPQAVVFCSLFLLTMSILGWTVASAVITADTKYISLKKVILNPAVLSMGAAFILFFRGLRLPDKLSEVTTLLGKMTTPLCMLVMGMRLATVDIREIFTDVAQYATVLIKQILMPLIAFGLISFFPFSHDFKVTLFILCACPVASVVLNFAEMLQQGQKTAANLVLLGTLLSVLTIPILLLLV